MSPNIFQILITDSPVDDRRFSPSLTQNIASFKTIYPQASYHLYTHEEISDYLTSAFPPEVAEAYHALIPFAFKADLARYCLLYDKGGIYSDLSHLHMRAIQPASGKTLVVFRDIMGHPSWATSNALIHAVPNLPVFQRAIERIVSHHRSGYHGQSTLDVTGPYMFGRVLSEGEDWTTTQFGESRLISREPWGRANIVKMMPSGAIVALRNKDKDSSIDEMVEGHANNYARLWKKGQIWGDRSKPGLFKRRPSRHLGRP